MCGWTGVCVCVCVCVCVTMEMFGVNTVVFYGKLLVIRCRRDVGGLHVLLSLMEKMLRYLAHTCNYFVSLIVFSLIMVIGSDGGRYDVW